MLNGYQLSLFQCTTFAGMTMSREARQCVFSIELEAHSILRWRIGTAPYLIRMVFLWLLLFSTEVDAVLAATHLERTRPRSACCLSLADSVEVIFVFLVEPYRVFDLFAAPPCVDCVPSRCSTLNIQIALAITLRW